jgi:hypothetical protein
MASASESLAVLRGLPDTRATLARWNAAPWPVLRAWAGASAAISAGLLLAFFVIAGAARPDPTPILMPALNTPATLGAAAHVLQRNGLVLALHSFACLAGYIAGSALPAEATRYRGLWRTIHDHAGPLAIAFVGCATAFSLATQAYVLGNAAATLAAQGSMSPALLLVGILPHAIPELIALFLPLAAWIIASRRGDWHELLAATFATTLLAVGMLLIAALVEVFVSPHAILWLRS